MLKKYLKMYLGERLISESDRRIVEGKGDNYMGIIVYDGEGNGSVELNKFTVICNDFINHNVPFCFESCNKLYLVAHGMKDGNIYDGDGYKVDKDCILSMISNKELLKKYAVVHLISCYNGLKNNYEVEGKKIVIPPWSKVNKTIKLSFFSVIDSENRISLMLRAVVPDLKYNLFSKITKRVLFRNA